MGDRKVYSSDKRNLHGVVRMVHQLSAGIGMEFAWEKCNSVNIRSGKVREDEGLLSFNTGDIMKSLNNKKRFKYLGFLQLKIARR